MAIDLSETLADSDIGRRIMESMEIAARQRDGVARQALWRCEDGWIVGYTTTRVSGGPFHDKWAVLVYKPVGKGARSGNASEWEKVYGRGFGSRKTAKKWALTHYYRHSPKAAASHGWNGSAYDRN